MKIPRLPLWQWLVLAIASIGFLFDTYELLMTPLVGVPGIAELLNVPPSNPLVRDWMGNMLWMTALCGGTFGLLGGWLIDRFGRKRIMAWAIFAYSFSPLAAAFSTSLGWFIFFRCTTFIGVCVEFVAAVTWLAELFPDKKHREIALGSTQAFASLGGVLITAVSVWILDHANALPALPLPEYLSAHATWRYTLMTGLLPAIPIALMLPFVPESKIWQEKRAAGTLKRPSFAELFSPKLRRVTLVTAGLSACAYGAAFGALQLTPLYIAPGTPELAESRTNLAPLQKEATDLNNQISAALPAFNAAADQVSGLREVASKRAQIRIAQRATKKIVDDPNSSADAKGAAKTKLGGLAQQFTVLDAKLAELTAQNPDAKKTVLDREKLLKGLADNRDKQEVDDKKVKARGNTSQGYQETGGLIGRIILALLVVTAISRRTLLQLFVFPGLLLLPLTYFQLYHNGGAVFDWGIFFCGLLIVAQFSYLGEFLPRVFPLHLRGTGGSFATNVGGRMIGTAAALLTTKVLAPMMGGYSTYTKVAVAAGIVGTFVFVVAAILSFFVPEPSEQEFAENPTPAAEAQKPATATVG